MALKNYYDILGLKRDATQQDIKIAFRKLSLKFHPDKNDGDEFLGEMFKNINEANETLSNAEKRKAYDYTFFKETGSANQKTSNSNGTNQNSSQQYYSQQNSSQQNTSQQNNSQKDNTQQNSSKQNRERRKARDTKTYTSNAIIDELTTIYLDKSTTATEAQAKYEKAEKISIPKNLTFGKVLWVALLLAGSYWYFKPNLNLQLKKETSNFEWTTIEKSTVYKKPNKNSKIIGEIDNDILIEELEQTKYFVKTKFQDDSGTEKEGFILKLNLKKNE